MILKLLWIWLVFYSIYSVFVFVDEISFTYIKLAVKLNREAVELKGCSNLNGAANIKIYIKCIWKSFWLLTNLMHNFFYDMFYIDTGQLAISQYPEGPATGHLDTGFSWFPWVQELMLRWFPPFQVASTCFSCSPPDINSVFNKISNQKHKQQSYIYCFVA
jgi:hypothetical protein